MSENNDVATEATEKSTPVDTTDTTGSPVAPEQQTD